MANRHTNEKLRLLVRRRMAETGETYQTALKALLDAERAPHRHGSTAPPSVDIVVAHYFGLPVTLAVFEAAACLGRPVIVRLPWSRQWRAGVARPAPFFNVRRAGWH
jgi:hypothetical protein